jgi:hypothetical protein
MKPFRKYMLNQIHKIDIDKWNEGERIHNDPGIEYILKWIRENGQKFHELWNKSVCKDCIHCEKCGYKVLKECDKYE